MPDGPELPDLIVLKVGVDEVPQGRLLGGRMCAVSGAVARESPEAWWSRRSRAGSWTRVLLVVAAAGRRRPSTFALVGATGKRNVRRRRHGDMWGATRGAPSADVRSANSAGAPAPPCGPAGPCTTTRDHGDGSDTRPRGRRTNGSLTETRVRDWQYWREWFDGSADRHMTPGPLDGTDQLARHVLAACIESDGPVDADGDQALVIYEAPPPDRPTRW